MIHDWSKLFDGAFHDFHAAWIAEIRKALNAGLLPPGYYAAAEQVVGGPNSDVVTLDSWQPQDDLDQYPDSFAGGYLLDDAAPAVQYRIDLERDSFVHRANRIAIRHLSNDRLVAVIEIISAGNKSSVRALQQFDQKIGTLMAEHVHLLLVDLIRSTAQCPKGLPAFLAFNNFYETPEVSEDAPFSLTAVRSGETYEAFIEIFGLTDTLVEMPLFLNDQHYIPLPLQQTYDAAWQGVPQPWKNKLTDLAT